MLSAAKTKDLEEVKKFINKKDALCSYKIDGLTIIVRYENGILKEAITRGNGYIGEDVTEQAKFIENLPMKIPYKDRLELRGECVISWDNFKKINDELEVPYSHPRNLAAGSIRQLDTSLVKQRHLELIIFDLIIGEPFNYKDQAFNWLESLGFDVVDHVLLINENDNTHVGESTVTSIEKADQYLNAERSPYPVDGQIYEFNDIAYGKFLGNTSHHSNKLIARKWNDDTYETKLRNVEWTIGKTGVLTPVAVFEPVEIDGSTVERASLHNISIMNELELSYGDTIRVYKANMIIPQVDENVDRSHTNIVDPPKKCPICGHKTKILKEYNTKVLYCTNTHCQGKLLGRLELFVSREGMNIIGLSSSQLQTFIDQGWIENPADIYQLEIHKDEMLQLDGFGEKSVENLLEAIDNSKETKMESFIRALGIDLIGKTQSAAISNMCNGDITKFEEMLQDETDFGEIINGFGKKRTKSIYKWFEDESNRTIYKKLRSIIHIKPKEKAKSSDAVDLTGKTFVITGSLDRFENRAQLKRLLESYGAKVTGSVSKNTTALICNDSTSNSSKHKKAQELGIPIWTEGELAKIISI